MFTVALIGPDGAGKSTIGRKLQQISPIPMKYVYMGVNLESSNLTYSCRLLSRIVTVRSGLRANSISAGASRKITKSGLGYNFWSINPWMRLVSGRLESVLAIS